MVGGQEREQDARREHGLVFVGDHQRGDAALAVVDPGTAEPIAVDRYAGERGHHLGAAHVGERVGRHDHVVGEPEQERRA